MILYVNGDSHSAGAEAVNNHCFAQDDPAYSSLGRQPHPDNLKVSYSQILANNLGYELVCDAESGSSNDRIIRTTLEYLKHNTPDLIVIGWATWEREEVLIDGNYYQFSAGWITDCWPPIPTNVTEQYKQWVTDRDDTQTYCESAQKQIWGLHQQLRDIPHLFFNTYRGLTVKDQFDFDTSYLNPYEFNFSYSLWLKNQGYQTVNQNSFHFGPDAHQAWANHLTNMLKDRIIAK